MKTLPLILGFCLIATGLPAAAPHPTVLTVKYKEELLPVIKVINSDPVVLVDGKEKRIRSEPLYLPQRAERFSREVVQIHNLSLTGTQIRFVADESDAANTEPIVGNQGGVAEFRATLKSEHSLSGGFIVVVLHVPLSVDAPDALARSQIVVHDLPPLPAGVAVPIKIGSKMFTYVPGQEYFVQLFDADGREIMTEAARPGWAFYAARERSRMAEIILRYREKYAGQNLPATPAIVIQPYLPANYTPPAEPVMVQLEVTMQGDVEDVSLTGVDDPRLARAVREAMAGWLFFPRLKAGEPVRSTVRLPLKF